jgi:glycosyltransferase involved in cell wall biosynthesis
MRRHQVGTVVASMRIAILTTSCHGGAGVAALRAASALQESGHTVHIWTRNGPSDGSWPVPITVVNLGPIAAAGSAAITRLDGAVTRTDKMIASPVSHDFTPIAEILEFRPDAVQFHNGFNLSTWQTVRHLAEHGLKVLLTLHDERWYTGACHHSFECSRYELTCRSCPQLRRGAKWLASHEHARAAAAAKFSTPWVTVVAPSRWVAQRARSSSILEGMQVVHVPNPISSVLLDRGATTIPVVANRGGLKIAWIPGKADHVLREALMYLKERQPECFEQLSLTFPGQAGPNWFPRPEGVPMLRSEHDRGRFWAAADIGLLTSEADNFPNVVLESLSQGTPFVAPKVGGAFEAVADTGGGWIYDGSPAHLAGLLGHLVRSRAEVDERGARAQGAFAALYSPDTYAKAIETISGWHSNGVTRHNPP